MAAELELDPEFTLERELAAERALEVAGAILPTAELAGWVVFAVIDVPDPPHAASNPTKIHAE